LESCRWMAWACRPDDVLKGLWEGSKVVIVVADMRTM
jgi:hypothetical protein